MIRLYSTGPVENAAGNSSFTTWVSVLNNNNDKETRIEASLYSLNGEKNLVGNTGFVVPASSSEYAIFDTGDIVKFEVQISVDPGEQVLISVWGKDTDSNLVAAHRFTQAELHVVNSDSESAKIVPVKSEPAKKTVPIKSGSTKKTVPIKSESVKKPVPIKPESFKTAIKKSNQNVSNAKKRRSR